MPLQKILYMELCKCVEPSSACSSSVPMCCMQVNVALLFRDQFSLLTSMHITGIFAVYHYLMHISMSYSVPYFRYLNPSSFKLTF